MTEFPLSQYSTRELLELLYEKMTQVEMKMKAIKQQMDILANQQFVEACMKEVETWEP